jgi:hypothetical protein
MGIIGHSRTCYYLRVMRARAPREWELGLPFPSLKPVDRTGALAPALA